MVTHFTTSPWEEPAQWLGVPCGRTSLLRHIPWTTREPHNVTCKRCLRTRVLRQTACLQRHVFARWNGWLEIQNIGFRLAEALTMAIEDARMFYVMDGAAYFRRFRRRARKYL